MHSPLEASGSAPKRDVDVLFEMVQGFRITQCLYVVAKLSVPDLLLTGPKDAHFLAGKVGVHPRSLFRVMRALASKGVFTQDSNDRFGLTPLSKLLCTNDPASSRFVTIMSGEEAYKATGELLHTVKTGETAFNYLYREGHFEFLSGHPEASETFNKAMAEGVRNLANPLESYDYTGRHLVVDVGGGRGDMIATILNANPSLKGVLFDLPQALTETPKLLRDKNVSDRCDLVRGSFFDAVPPSGDVYTLSRVLHDWPDDKAKIILGNCRKAIRKDGTLLIREAVIPEGDTPSRGKLIDLTMLITLGGAERTEKEWTRLLHESGFALKQIRRSGGAFDLIEATPS